MLSRIINRIRWTLARGAATRSAYHFLIYDWSHISDLELAQRTLISDCFRDQVVPVELPLNRYNRYLVISPHQDDETIGAGGLMCRLQDLRKQVHICYVLDGAQNLKQVAPTARQVVEIRKEEARQAADLVGARTVRLDISDTNPDPTVEDVRALSDVVEEFAPDVLLLPWLLDRPVKHRLANHLVMLAHMLRPLACREIWSYQVHNDIVPSGFVDISAVVDRKKELLACFSSQNDLRRYDHTTIGLNAWNSRWLLNMGQPAEAKYLELFFAVPAAEYVNLLETVYCRDWQQVYRNAPALRMSAERLHDQVKRMTAGTDRGGFS